MTSDKVKRDYMIMLAPAPAQNDDRRYAAAMLAQILGDGEGSRLHWALIEPGLADEAQAQFDGRDQAGEFVVYASCSTESANEVEQALLNEIESLVSSLTEDDLERVRSKIATAATLHGELPAGRMTRLRPHVAGTWRVQAAGGGIGPHQRGDAGRSACGVAGVPDDAMGDGGTFARVNPAACGLAHFKNERHMLALAARRRVSISYQKLSIDRCGIESPRNGLAWLAAAWQRVPTPLSFSRL